MKDSTLTNSLNELNDYLDGKDIPMELHVRSIDLTPQYTATDIKDLRRKLNVTQVEFAKIMEVSPRTVESWEIGKSNPKGSVCRLMEIFTKYPKLANEYKF
ncbi:DNA-binding transcriptional regulator [Lactobacillus sp. ESL0230]|uniref:helix-turn-helix domain-containing protein n=1 Tax=Lactobacillus sp. ESL0230 TaxID=2069353 RepID=UPI000EFAC8BC|nr:helix-turn-helix domain-containing protein [Lactobacillus sp. ESL0230]RMC46121.1 helix-turn-helix domain-containing protein [Lactobacillus sp. ESL0230]